MTANAYSFLPWLRTGISTKITGAPGTEEIRASLAVKLVVSGDPLEGTRRLERTVDRPVQLYGPGDIVGIDAKAVSRTEPRPWVTNAEPNYLAHIEFYDEDLPWRYSPTGQHPETGRLPPWLALIVLEGPGPAKDSRPEFEDGTLPGRPLPYITVLDPATTLPDPAHLSAWAHVHVNGALDDVVLSEEERLPGALATLRGVLRANPDLACSRLMCPRKLLPDKPYHAFLVPAFETGRLAGLGFDPKLAARREAGALHSSWGPAYPDRPAAGQLPYYYRWFFGTGPAGDFEHLVRLLRPRRPDLRVGRRDIDVRNEPGPALPGITTPAQLGGVLRLGGALKVPGRRRDIWDNWDARFPPPPPAPSDPPPTYPHAFQEALAALINLADAYLETPPAQAHRKLATLTGAPDAHYLAGRAVPVVTPPLYGKWHARTSRVLRRADGTPVPAPENRNWVHRLNLDPRFRVAANFGTQVVQTRQEEFMAAAWQQVGDVIDANNRIRAAQLAREVGHVLHGKHLDPPAAPGVLADDGTRPARSLRLTAPALSRVTAAARGAALRGALDGTGDAVAFQVAGSTMAAAPLSPEMRRITRPGARLTRAVPAGAPVLDTLLAKMDLPTAPVTAAPAKAVPAAVVTPEELDGVLHPPGPGARTDTVATDVSPGDAAGGPVPSADRHRTPGPDGSPGEPYAPAAEQDDPVSRLPTSSAFVISLPGEGVVPPTGGADSEEALRFKEALRDVHRAYGDAAVGGRAPVRERLDVPRATGEALAGLAADATVPRSLLTSVRLPERLTHFADAFLEAMAHPVIDLPMYQSLIDMSVDTFVPHLHLVPPDSITLLESDQEFIEAYMTGLNHEFGRELLWREYPTDQHGTPFRQFWDPRPALSLPGESAAERQERLYDIAPIASWTADSLLGAHDNRDRGGAQQEELVLVIRGELLKKYPTAVVYAHKADWARDDDGTPHPERERVLARVADEEHPPAHLVKLPLYEAKVEPDITLLGFDLTKEAARGHIPTEPGWFFVIKERPGDPRFGADDGEGTAVEVWNDLSWKDIAPNGRFLELDPAIQVPLVPFDGSEDDPEKEVQRREDIALPLWDHRLSSADVAYMLFQAPVLIAAHAQEMLHDAPE
ncbi:hypothetical protein [Streptomyces sp. NPDC017940]|uniref:hypothetical protein n=1 Tax=Streptomyces sp. NPDC017940 TaxID=3365017 RepID=UPI0037A4D0AF